MLTCIIIHSILDGHYLELASSEFFLNFILSSTTLHDATSFHFVLYQFVLRRPLLSAGGKMLPGLVSFYLWLHESFTCHLTPQEAQELTIERFLSSSAYLKPVVMKKQQEQFTKLRGKYYTFSYFLFIILSCITITILELYQRYSEVCENKLPPLNGNTELIALLSVATQLKEGNILYNTIMNIVRIINYIG